MVCWFKGLITSAFLSFKSLNSMSKSFGRSFRIDKSYSVLAVKTFCSWDFRVIKKNSTNLMSENISTQLKVLINTPQRAHTHSSFVFVSVCQVTSRQECQSVRDFTFFILPHCSPCLLSFLFFLFSPSTLSRSCWQS